METDKNTQESVKKLDDDARIALETVLKGLRAELSTLRGAEWRECLTNINRVKKKLGWI